MFFFIPLVLIRSGSVIRGAKDKIVKLRGHSTLILLFRMMPAALREEGIGPTTNFLSEWGKMFLCQVLSKIFEILTLLIAKISRIKAQYHKEKLRHFHQDLLSLRILISHN